MIIYLDQNKWIELARVVHGIDTAAESINILEEISATVSAGLCIIPLSGIHYMETARISDPGRRKRLGQVMWTISRGYTIASFKNIIIHELEVVLSEHFSGIEVSPFMLIGKGCEHAFGEKFPHKLPSIVEDEFERSILTGEPKFGEKPPQFYCDTFRKDFQHHLNGLDATKDKISQKKWEDMLYAIVLVDIAEPLSEVMQKNNISKAEIESLGAVKLRALIENMPSRAVDMHLHRQVLRNAEYRAKVSDLEDWAGVGVAAQYCDVVVCEKHLGDMLRRDKFKTKARIETSLKRIFQSV